MSPLPFEQQSAAVTLHVCLTCRQVDEEQAIRDGTRLHDRLISTGAPPTVRIEGVKCLSGCKRACTVALSGEGRWSYIIGDLNADMHAADILRAAELYAAAPDGIVPWRDRPEIMKRGVIARVPPLTPAKEIAA